MGGQSGNRKGWADFHHLRPAGGGIFSYGAPGAAEFFQTDPEPGLPSVRI